MPSVRLPYEIPDQLRTARLVLRHMTDADVDDIHAYQSLPDVARYVPYDPRSREEVAAKVAQFGLARTLAADGDYWQLAIERGEAPGRVIGDVYFSIKSVTSAAAEIGWAMHPDHYGRGYMTEAAGAVLEVAFGTLGLHRVWAQLDARNEASAALCRRLGMRLEAQFLEEMWFKGEWSDTDVYAILDREWSAGYGRGPTSSSATPAA